MGSRDVILPQTLVRDGCSPLGIDRKIEPRVERPLAIAGIGEPPEFSRADIAIFTQGEPTAQTPFAALPDIQSCSRNDAVIAARHADRLLACNEVAGLLKDAAGPRRQA